MLPKQEHDSHRHDHEAHTSLSPHRSPRIGTAATAPTNRRGGKKSRFPSGSQQTEGLHVQHETHAVAEQPQQQSRDHDHGPRQALPREERHAHRADPCTQHLEPGHDNGIAEGHSLAEIIVDGPAEASAHDRKKSSCVRAHLLRPVLEERRRAHNQQGPCDLTTTEVLAK